MDKKQAIDWLETAAKYFESRETNGEDLAYWSNVSNAQSARKIAKLIVDTSQ